MRKDNDLLRAASQALDIEQRNRDYLRRYYASRAIHTNATRMKTPRHRSQYPGAQPINPCEV